MSTELRTQLQTSLGAAYTLERELGGGGMSRVFVAQEQALGRRVVVKVLPPDLVAGVSVERFRREIQVAARLQHPHIVPVLATGEMDGHPYFTMPYVEGESLRARLTRGPLPMADAVSILRDVARALAYAHEHGVVHRDIKPDNVLLAGTSATVTDFGIAKALTAARTDHGGPEGQTLTQMGTALGTPAYMAPEQAAADPETDHRADIYAFGCLAYELLAGRPPFVEKSPQRLLAAHMGAAPQPILVLRPDTPRPLAELVMRCLEKEAGRRPQHALELARALDTVTSSGDGMASLPAVLLGGPRMLRRALLVWAAAFVGVALVTRVAIVAIGLPDWVLPGALLVMALGLPVLLFTGYVAHVARLHATTAPTDTPGGTRSVASAPGTMATLAIKASPHVSWRRATTGGVVALVAFAALVGGYMLLRVLGIGPAGSLLAAGKIDRDARLIVADFATSGGVDSSLAGVIAEAIRTDLGQSSVLQVVPRSAIGAALQRMQRPADGPLDAALAREVAQREGIGVVVDGGITPLGGGFIVTARLTAAATGDELTSVRETADGPRDLIPTVEKLSRTLRSRAGESFRSVRASPPLARVTTPSLEALRKYSEGNAISDADVNRSVALLRDAVAIDTGFAMAWRKLAVLYSNADFPRAQIDSAATRAYRHHDRLTEAERATVDGWYFGQVRRDRAREAAVYEAVMPRDSLTASAHNLALIYLRRREYARAESLYRRLVRNPSAALIAHQNLAWTLVERGDLRGADSVVQLAARRYAGAAPLSVSRASVLWAAGRQDSAAATLARLRATASAHGAALANLGMANLELARGRPQAALRAIADARRLNASTGVALRPATDSAYAALLDAWLLGEPARAVRRTDANLARMPLGSRPEEDQPWYVAVMTYAVAGRPDRARALLARYTADVRDTVVRRDQEPMLHDAMAEIALAERRPLDAVREFRLGDQRPDGPVDACAICVDADLGRAFAAAGMPDSAIMHLERYVTGPEYRRLFPMADAVYLAPSLKQLGELYEAKGDRAKAIRYYGRFLELWKDVEPELQPVVREVRDRAARLADTDRR